jgi:glutathione S-transferase
VPALVLDNGEMLSEGPAIVQYLADLVPAKKLAPPAGSFERVRLQEVLNYISTELHKSFSPLFNPAAPEDWKTFMRGQILRRLEPMEKRLAKADYLMGEFTVADAYLFTILGWTRLVGIDLKENAVLSAYIARVKARPAVQQAMKEEGLIKPA